MSINVTDLSKAVNVIVRRFKKPEPAAPVKHIEVKQLGIPQVVRVRCAYNGDL